MFNVQRGQERAMEPVLAFYSNMNLLLPLCLKSIVIRCSLSTSSSSSDKKVVVDETHMKVLSSMMVMLASCVVAEAAAADDGRKSQSIAVALIRSDAILDFIVGLACVLHPQQLSEIVSVYFKTLRETEIAGKIQGGKQKPFVWDGPTLHRVRCSRQLRLHSVERLCTIGPFLAMNYPLKFPEWKGNRKANPPKWTNQNVADRHAEAPALNFAAYDDGYNLLPQNGWLADLLLGEALAVCSLSCEAVVAEAMAHLESTQPEANGSPSSKALVSRPGKSLTRVDLLVFQSTAIHAMTIVYELILRRHALDSRFQNEQSRSRIAALFAKTLIEKSVASVRWLARMESTHKVRSLWLLCFVYILQEAPEAVLRSSFRALCYPQVCNSVGLHACQNSSLTNSAMKEFGIHRLIRILRLCSSTFQCLVDDSNSVHSTMTPWLLQESFNSVCASLILIIDECATQLATYPLEMRKMAQGMIDLLLHILTVPQSAVTHLRTVGGALLAIDKFGVEMFLDVVGDNLQHWIRVMVTLMSSISLSVRSIAVDFIVSLLGYTFSLNGSIEHIAIPFATVLPEVVAREIALTSVDGLIEDMNQIERAVWPLRRALADLEDANPLDDDRIDPQLPPILSVFCRGCQAVIDGVIVELRLSSGDVLIVGRKAKKMSASQAAFDADEESIFEAANFFPSESAPVQRLRWLQTLKTLHVEKKQWVEAAETLMLAARTIADSLPHLKSVWMPSEFALWNDNRRSLWLDTIGRDQGFPDRGNSQVMEFAASFLHPATVFGETQSRRESGKLVQPTVPMMCMILINVVNEAVLKYSREDGLDELAFARLEDLLRVVIEMVEDHNGLTGDPMYLRSIVSRKRHAEEAAALRRLLASLNGHLTKISEKLLLTQQSETISNTTKSSRTPEWMQSRVRKQYYVRVLLSGRKPRRFAESTGIPPFLEWNNPCVCRVPQALVEQAMEAADSEYTMYHNMCSKFGKPLRDALAAGSVVKFTIQGPSGYLPEASPDTLLDISMAYVDLPGMNLPAEVGGVNDYAAKRFFCREARTDQEATEFNLMGRLVELTVAQSFPCALSRQRTLITSEVVPESV